MKKEFYIGKAKELGKVRISIRLEVKQNSESICHKCKGSGCDACYNGKTYNRLATDLTPAPERYWVVAISADARGQGGQMQDSIRNAEWIERYIPEEKLNGLLNVWDRWHLNDMKGGSDLQNQIIDWFYDREAIEKMVLNRMANELTVSREMADKFCDAFFNENDNKRSEALARLTVSFDTNSAKIAAEMESYKREHKSHYELASELLKHHCLHKDTFKLNGKEFQYSYGSKWLIEPVPEEVIQFLETLPAYVVNEGANQLDPRWEWMLENKIKCLSIVIADFNPNMITEHEMDHWLATFENESGDKFKAYYSTGIGHRVMQGEFTDSMFKKQFKRKSYLKWFKDNGIATSLSFGTPNDERDGLPKPPYPYQILGAYISDCASIECHRGDWTDWAEESGYDLTDKKVRREVHKTYLTIQTISDELTSFLGQSDFIDLYNEVFMD